MLKRKVNEMLPTFPIFDDKKKIENDYDIYNKQLKVYKCPFYHQSVYADFFNFICHLRLKKVLPLYLLKVFVFELQKKNKNNT